MTFIHGPEAPLFPGGKIISGTGMSRLGDVAPLISVVFAISRHIKFRNYRSYVPALLTEG